MEPIEDLARTLAEAERAVAFTGAGISTESGIPDFRGDEGLWKDHDPMDLHIRRFRRDPGAFWETWIKLHDSVASDDPPEPNRGHRVLADLVREGRLKAVITQNGDGLHQDAGTPGDAVVELHGTFRQAVCRGCEATEEMDAVVARVRKGETPPSCGECGALVKPGAVLFGQALPASELARAQRLAESSQVFLVVGSSLSVHPAASLPVQAKRSGAHLAIVNLDPTPADGLADVLIHRGAGETLQDLADTLEDRV